jgi:O-6-methylguanine DNA methyltransferase
LSTTAIEKNFFYHSISTPIGPLVVIVSHSGVLYRISFGQSRLLLPDVQLEKNRYACGAVVMQLEQYFAGERQSFSLDYHVDGTAFQKDVWYRVGKVAYGETIAYAEIARKAGRKTAVRSIATAIGRNPLPIVIPCHRVIRSNGNTGFYALSQLGAEEGCKIKRYLLDLEASFGS